MKTRLIISFVMIMFCLKATALVKAQVPDTGLHGTVRCTVIETGSVDPVTGRSKGYHLDYSFSTKQSLSKVVSIAGQRVQVSVAPLYVLYKGDLAINTYSLYINVSHPDDQNIIARDVRAVILGRASFTLNWDASHLYIECSERELNR